LIQNFAGSYQFDSSSENNNNKEIQNILGYLPQGVSFQEWRTVNHALTTLGKLSGLTDELLEKQISNVLELMDLSDVHYSLLYPIVVGLCLSFVFLFFSTEIFKRKQF